MEKTILLGKSRAQGKVKPSVRWTDSVKEAVGVRLQELSRASGHEDITHPWSRQEPESTQQSTHIYYILRI